MAACATAPPAPPPAEAPPSAPAAEAAMGTVRVNASTLNLRAEASAASEIVGHVRRGERLTLLADSGDWLKVRLGDGATGWVSSQHVVREGAAARPRGGCPPDSDYRLAMAAKPSFSEGGPHGLVTVEASVDVKGRVTATRVVSNTTADESLSALAEREIRGATFTPPIHNCVARAFIYTFKRAF